MAADGSTLKTSLGTEQASFIFTSKDIHFVRKRYFVSNFPEQVHFNIGLLLLISEKKMNFKTELIIRLKVSY